MQAAAPPPGHNTRVRTHNREPMRLCSQRTGALQASSTSHGSAATWRPIPPETDLRTDVDPCGSRLSLQGAAVTPGEVGQRVLGLGGEAQELPPAARVVGLGALELAFDGLPTCQHPQRVWVEVLVRVQLGWKGGTGMRASVSARTHLQLSLRGVLFPQGGNQKVGQPARATG